MIRKLSLLLTIMVLFIVGCDKSTGYDEWKDSVTSFGDGTYQIFHQAIKGESVEILTNCKYNQCVLTEIDAYVQESDTVYFIGNYYTKKVYCKLNIKTNLLLYFAEENEEKFIMTYLNNMIADKQFELYSSYDRYSDEDKKKFDCIGSNF